MEETGKLWRLGSVAAREEGSWGGHRYCCEEELGRATRPRWVLALDEHWAQQDLASKQISTGAGIE